MESGACSVFGLMTRLCEKVLDERNNCKDGPSSRIVWMKKLRSKAYSILLSPPDHELQSSPHECFVKIIATVFDKGTRHDNVYMQEFDRCIDQLWQESKKRSYIPSVIYFLASLHNERQTLDNLLQDTATNGDGNFDNLGFPVCSLPKKYHLYHPSSFILPDLHSAVARDTRMNSLSNSQKLRNNSVALPICGFQCNLPAMKNYSGKGYRNLTFSAFPCITQNQHEIAAHQLEDEGYVSPGATPMGTAPGEWSSTPWYELDGLDLCSDKKACHLTWEALGEPAHALEPPPVMEAGNEALHCNIKIRECLLLTLEPRISIKSKGAIHWKSLLHHVTYLLMGLESESFYFNEQFDRFELVADTWLEGISSEALAACLTDCIAMGTCFRRLSAFVETPENDDCSEGVVQQALRNSTGHYLHLYRGACLLVMQNLLQRRSFSILLMKLKLKGLQQQILCLASAYGRWGCGAPIPNGVGALGHLHRHASGAQRKDVASLLSYILHSACLAYFNLLERWVYDGEVVDGGDFFVVPRLEYVSCRSRRYWTRAFSFNAAAVPEFLCGLKPFLLRCGKSVHFLKLCDQKNTFLEDDSSLAACLKKNQNLSLNKEEQVELIVSVKEGEPSSEEPHCLPSKPAAKDSALQKDKINLRQPEAEKKSAETFEETGSLEGIDKFPLEQKEPRKLREREEESLPQIAAQSKWNEEEMLDDERQKLIGRYKKLSEASDKRRLKAEWRTRRMRLRIGDTLPEDQGVAGGNSLQDPPGVATVSSIVMRKDDSSDCQLVPEESRVALAIADECKATDNVTSELEEASEERETPVVKVNKLSETEGKVEVTKGTTLDHGTEKIDERAEDSIIVEDLEKLAPQECLECSVEEDKPVTQEVVASEKVLQQEDAPSSPSVHAHTLHFRSPSRTPLLKLSGLFPFNPALPGTETSKEETTQDEAHPSEWPYRSVLFSLMIQSQKMDAALLKLMLVEKGLVSHLRSLRAYFFLLDGEFGRRLSEDLFSAMRRAPGGKPSVESLNVVALGSLLSHALASSTFAASDPNASLLSLTLRKCSTQSPGMDPLACVQMLYEAPWPLNVVLTEEAISKYSRVLDLLLRLKHASWALEDTFLHLRVLEPGKGIAKVFPRGWRTPHEAVQNSPQYHKLQLYRHQMMHFVCVVQSYISAGVLQASGKKLEEAIAHSTCLDDFYAEHVLYVKRILFGCLLNRRSETIANILNDILRLIMKFQWSLCSRSWFIPPDHENQKSCHFEHPNFNVLCRIFGAFEDMTDFLLKYAWRLASRGYQVHLFELLQMLNVNNFYKLDNGEDASGKDQENYAVLT